MTTVAFVTGGNKGIGYCICKQLVAKGVSVLLGARDANRGQQAATELAAEGGKVTYVPVDLDDLDSLPSTLSAVQKLAPEGIDILINNAAIAYKQASTAPFLEQAETSLKVNFIGTVQLTEVMHPAMKKGGRIVTVSSRAGLLKIFKSEALVTELKSIKTIPELIEFGNRFVKAVAHGEHQQNGWPSTAYGTSKALVTKAMQIFAADPRYQGMIVSSCCPGWCRTDMAGPNATKSADDGADTPVWLALEQNAVNGGFWGERTQLTW